MDLVKNIVRQYWLNMLAMAIFLAAIARYVYLGKWEEHLGLFAFAAMGFVCVIASEEVAEWSGSYGWTHEQWRHYPHSVIRFFGGVSLVVTTVLLYYR